MRESTQGDGFEVRRAGLDDVATLARHRCEMFSDMGQLQSGSYDALLQASIAYFEQAIPRGDYVAWLVSLHDTPEQVVAGGGVQMRELLPRPTQEGQLQAPGKQALIVNMYTEPQWRRQGLAELIVRTILAWCAEQSVPSVVLHASKMGRPLYERMGFEQTNEMYYPTARLLGEKPGP